MPINLPRVAYFPDSFHEVNGVAHTSRHFEAFARRGNLPFLCIRGGDRSEALIEDGNVWTLELPRGIFSFALEKDLRFDPAFPRHIPIIGEVLDRFRPDLIHITGPSEVGMLGAGLAYHRDLPLAASWHTNVHEYLARRSDWLLRLLPERHSFTAGKKIENVTLATAARFYALAKVLFAPNIELCKLLESSTERPCHLMPRGVDTELFTAARRNRAADDTAFVLGFVGRLSVEKNVTLLATIHDQLIALGHTNFRFLIIGHGQEEAWLRERMTNVEFAGVLRGEELAQAYANMDLFVFPSHTDTFGNVVLEALASGVPAIVTPDGGPRYIVHDTANETATGRIVPDEGFTESIAAILSSPATHSAMRTAARAYALTASWDAVFEGVYSGYQEILPASHELAAAI
ncbi:glycosyltransferase [Acidicapsa ligni]|uniref:glycosyltransferase n=1 Tax=Acidicapsa ligni TaxID=542300 RepID=UPI0021DFCD83|nr:glycosyltransferase [Acidicapsa ligni]